jgi:hypothetical protein
MSLEYETWHAVVNAEICKSYAHSSVVHFRHKAKLRVVKLVCNNTPHTVYITKKSFEWHRLIGTLPLDMLSTVRL